VRTEDRWEWKRAEEEDKRACSKKAEGEKKSVVV
jgi:hypothetical protein